MENKQQWPVTYLLYGAVVFLLKLLFVNMQLFDAISFGGLLSDLGILIILLVLGWILHVPLKGYYIGLSALMSFIWLATLMYNDYYGSIVTTDALNQAGQLGEVQSSVFALFHWSYLLLIADLIIVAFIRWKRPSSGWSARWLAAVICAVLVVPVVWNINHHQGILNERAQAEQMGVLSYQLQHMFVDEAELEELPAETAKAELQSLRAPASQPLQYNGAAQDSDVIVIQVEAMQRFPVGLSLEGVELTPNLNALMQDSLFFNRIYQQIGKGNTSDAEFMMNTSIYPTGHTPMAEYVGGSKVPSLPHLLKEHGYESVTFHTNDVSFWSRDKMYPALGFDRYYDKSYFGTEDKIAFSASDEVLFDKSFEVLKELADKDQKFYANIITMSSHHPFEIPADKPQLQLPASIKDTSVGKYLNAMHYADYAIGKFIQELKDAGMWENTTLLIYGDHYGLQLPQPADQAAIEEVLGRPYDDKLDAFNIPFILHAPGVKPAVMDIVGGQVDFMPTLINLLGLTEQANPMFGEDLLNHENNLIGNRFYAPSGTFMNNEVLYVPGADFASGSAKRVADQSPVDPAPYQTDYEKVLKLMELSDRYIYTVVKESN